MFMLTSKFNQRLFNWKIILGFILISISSLPLNVQAQTKEYQFLEDIEAGKNVNWSFSSEDETVSLKDEIEALGDYSISNSDVKLDLELSEEDRKWGNRGDAKDYYLEAEVYNY